MQAAACNLYRIVKNFGGKKIWRNDTFETLAKKLWRIQSLVHILVHTVLNSVNWSTPLVTRAQR